VPAPVPAPVLVPVPDPTGSAAPGSAAGAGSPACRGIPSAVPASEITPCARDADERQRRGHTECWDCRSHKNTFTSDAYRRIP
jgi:hypothetical protein